MLKIIKTVADSEEDEDGEVYWLIGDGPPQYIVYERCSS